MSASTLSDIKLHVRFKLSALWAALTFCYLYGDYFGLYVPAQLQYMLDGGGPIGPVSQGSLIQVALLLAVPGLMVFLSLALWSRLCRWLNIVLGAFYTAVMLYTMTIPGGWWFYIALGVIEVVLSLLIVGYAWRWPRHLTDQCLDEDPALADAVGLKGTAALGVMPRRQSIS